jgi:hypothetical protein
MLSLFVSNFMKFETNRDNINKITYVSYIDLVMYANGKMKIRMTEVFYG